MCFVHLLFYIIIRPEVSGLGCQPHIGSAPGTRDASIIGMPWWMRSLLAGTRSLVPGTCYMSLRGSPFIANWFLLRY